MGKEGAVDGGELGKGRRGGRTSGGEREKGSRGGTRKGKPGKHARRTWEGPVSERRSWLVLMIQRDNEGAMVE